MKSIVLIGDSIRMGYQPVVEQALQGDATVWAPKENGGTSANVLAHLDEWVTTRRPDIVHLNCGLHDLKTEFDADTPSIPLDLYTANLEAIFARICQETRATLVWATTTPVNESWHHKNKPFDRFESDVLAYNRAALHIAAHFQVPVNDLYQVVMDAGRDAHLAQDGVHFGATGYRLLGKAVETTIRSLL